MMLTEEEARKKWCPFARVVASDPDAGQSPTYNRHVSKDGSDLVVFVPYSSTCIASDCGQWVPETEIAYETSAGTTKRIGERPTDKGFCGRNIGLAIKLFGIGRGL